MYHLGSFPLGTVQQAAELAPLITGDFTGTTQEILKWAACKWGIDQDVVFAQAAVESWWQQTELGDWTTNVKPAPLDTASGPTAHRASARRATAFCRTGTASKRRPGPALPCLRL